MHWVPLKVQFLEGYCRRYIFKWFVFMHTPPIYLKSLLFPSDPMATIAAELQALSRKREDKKHIANDL